MGHAKERLGLLRDNYECYDPAFVVVLYEYWSEFPIIRGPIFGFPL